MASSVLPSSCRPISEPKCGGLISQRMIYARAIAGMNEWGHGRLQQPGFTIYREIMGLFGVDWVDPDGGTDVESEQRR